MLTLPIPFGHIDVIGSTVITAEDVIFEGNISQPVNILQVNTSDLKERLVHDLRIESVSINRKFPFAIEVEINEKKAIAVMQGEYAYAFLDKYGNIMQMEPSIESSNLPMITGRKLGNVLLGDQLKDSQILKAIAFINGMSAEGANAFSEVNIGNPDNIMAYTRDGISVRLKNGDNIKEQAALAENMVSDVRARGLSVEYLDANLTSPFIKLKK